MMHFRQLFVGQRRTKILIFLLDQIQCLLHDTRIQTMITRLAATLVGQPFCTLLAVGSPQPLHLPKAQAQHPRSFFLCQSLFLDPLHDFQATEFLFAHRYQFIHF